MKNVIFIFTFILFGCNIAMSQTIEGIYLTNAYAIHKWELNEGGIYTAKTNVPITSIIREVEIKNIYNYNSKERRLHVKLDDCHCVYFLTEESNKYVKKELKKYNIPNLKPADLFAKETLVNEEFKRYYSKVNSQLIEKKLDEERKAKEEEIKKQQTEDSLKLDNYRKTHDWRKFKIPISLYCQYCDDVHTEDSVYVSMIDNDSISYGLYHIKTNMVGENLLTMHHSGINNMLKSDNRYKEYTKIWNDTIANHNTKGLDFVQTMNLYLTGDFIAKVKKIAPYGFIKDWGWELNSVAGIEPYFKYTNTSDKTIKYIDFYFTLTNPVGDACKIDGASSGHVRGVGPVESFETGEWNWDRATHYTSYTASNMQIIKLVITYMDKSVKTILKNQIVYDEGY